MVSEISFHDLAQQWGIALTGGIASGKSTIGRSLKARGHVVIDADQVSRLVVLPGTEGLDEIVKTFGRQVLTPQGDMDRVKMRELVFADAAQRLKLESIIHHRLEKTSTDLLRAEGLMASPRTWFYEASLIYERGREKDFAEVWVAYCPLETQMIRVMARDSINRTQAEAILSAQMPAAEKARLADRIIDTNCDPDELERRITTALKSIERGSHRE